MKNQSPEIIIDEAKNRARLMMWRFKMDRLIWSLTITVDRIEEFGGNKNEQRKGALYMKQLLLREGKTATHSIQKGYEVAMNLKHIRLKKEADEFKKNNSFRLSV